jgi:hypothetical protein
MKTSGCLPWGGEISDMDDFLKVEFIDWIPLHKICPLKRLLSFLFAV